MWEWVDSAGTVLFDATLSTALFLSLVVVAMLVCRQPTRRLLIARVALLASLAMIPLVALVPLPRLDLLDTLVQTDILPQSVILELETGAAPGPGSIEQEHKSYSPYTQNLHDRILGNGRWLPRFLTLTDLAFVATGTAWLMLGFWGVRWLIRHSQPPSAAAAGGLRPAARRRSAEALPPGIACEPPSSTPGRCRFLQPDDPDTDRP